MKMVQLLVIRMMWSSKNLKHNGIEHRRYADDNLNSSDLAFLASKKAIENAAIDPENRLYFCTQFGDVKHGTSQSDTLPSLATRVKNKLQIKPKVCCLRYPFGCPGWIEGYFKQMLHQIRNGATLSGDRF
jgi:3-oxoacyl-[acyl-carrier-protein] synthase III